MIVKTYVARRGSRISDKDAQRIGKFLEKKMGKAGRDAEEIVAAATPENSPIHQDFEWDDTIAGQLHRLHQARYIAGAIKVIYTNGESSQPTRAFHHIVIEEGDERRSTYVPADVVWETPDMAEQVLDTARRELEAWSNRYREYESLAGASALVDKALEAIAA